MEHLKIEDLLNTLWQEIEVYVIGATDRLNPRKSDNLKKRIDIVMEEAERQLSYTFIELGHNHKGKGHRVDAVLEQTIALSLKADAGPSDEQPSNLYRAELLEYFLTALDRLMVNIRLKFSHLQYANLMPPPHYVKYIQHLQIDKVEYIFKTLREANLRSFLADAFEDYFANPIPLNHSSRIPNDGFRSLDYFVGLVESLHEICGKTPMAELEEAIYYELINRNFNRIPFIRAIANAYKKTFDEVDDLIDEIGQLYVMDKEIRNIPVISGMAYIPSDAGLKEILLRTISTQIRYLKNMIKHQEEDIASLVHPAFSTNRNVLQFLMLFNAFLNLSYLMKIGKGSIPLFIQQSFVRANGESFSLGSLQKKNSIRDRKNAQGLVEMLSKMIEYITRNYL